MSSATCEVVWLRRILDDVGVKQEEPTKFHHDNQSALKLTHNPVYHARSKHIELQHHFSREMKMLLIYLLSMFPRFTLKSLGRN